MDISTELILWVTNDDTLYINLLQDSVNDICMIFTQCLQVFHMHPTYNFDFTNILTFAKKYLYHIVPYRSVSLSNAKQL